MKTIAVINQKGGVGKSTTAQAIGSGLTSKGYKVLFIDLDMQGNLSYTMRADIEGKYNALGVMQFPNTIFNEIQKTSLGDIVASSPALAGADTIITQTGKEYRLKESLDLIKDNYDFCVIDTPPALGILTINALTACDGAIVPALADIYSLQGIGHLGGTINTVKKYCNPNLKVLGIVMTRFNGRSIITRDVTEMIESTAHNLDTQVYKARIRECTAIREAQALKTDIFSYAPKSNASKDYLDLVEEIYEQLK